jgi:hypothetical protein
MRSRISKNRNSRIHQTAVGRGAMNLHKFRNKKLSNSRDRYPTGGLDRIDERLDFLKSQMKKPTGREMKGPMILTHKKPIVQKKRRRRLR